jgi:signal transduction histidine kinase
MLVEDSERFQRDQEISDAKERVSSIRDEIRALVSGIRESVLAASVCSEMRRAIRRLRQEQHECYVTASR